MHRDAWLLEVDDTDKACVQALPVLPAHPHPTASGNMPGVAPGASGVRNGIHVSHSKGNSGIKQRRRLSIKKDRHIQKRSRCNQSMQRTLQKSMHSTAKVGQRNTKIIFHVTTHQGHTMHSVYQYVVEFQKIFVSGPMKGLTVNDSLGFCTQSDAVFFAKRDGLIVSPFNLSSDYRQENSRVINKLADCI